MRVTGDPDPTNNGLFYLHNDHLGSVSAMSDVNGNLVLDSTARYLPFGDWRTEPGTNPAITDRGYTSHKSNNSGANDLGLIYMNARWYLPGAARFASADTIVPDPANPQGYNRYSYALNRPLVFTDPSGHMPSDGCHNEGCNLPDFLPSDGTWINTEGSYLLYDPQFSREPLDAFGGGISFSTAIYSPGGNIEGNIGLEEVVDPDTDRMTTFLVVGGDLSLGPDMGFIDFIKDTIETNKYIIRVSANFYGVAIHNVDDPVVNYSGQFLYDTTTAADGIGATWGEAYSPGDPSRKLAYSETAGLTVSTTALTKNVGTNFYVPLMTVDPLRFDMDFHWSEALGVLRGN